ncbi:hypothetical protein [Nonomuraea endophytica]|uniref:hypothetical protein n=1 Tax=Nonomuraea endophytica TaxID=714136 RepID=UPI0037C66117
MGDANLNANAQDVLGVLIVPRFPEASRMIMVLSAKSALSSIAVIIRSAIACFPFSGRGGTLEAGRVSTVHADPLLFGMNARGRPKGSTVSLTRNIQSRARIVQGWIMLYFGRATGNQHLESKGLASRDGHDPRRRTRKIKGMSEH